MYGTTTAAATISQALTDTGTLVTLVLAGVVGGVVALMGLGFGYRHLKKYITGRKF